METKQIDKKENERCNGGDGADDQESARTCIICTDELTEPCFLHSCAEAGIRHVFDRSCIEYWYKTSGVMTCPVCKRPSALLYLEKDAPPGMPFKDLPRSKTKRFNISSNAIISSEPEILSQLQYQIEEFEDEDFVANGDGDDDDEIKDSEIDSEYLSDSEDGIIDFDSYSDISEESDIIAFSVIPGEETKYSQSNYEKYYKKDNRSRTPFSDSSKNRRTNRKRKDVHAYPYDRDESEVEIVSVISTGQCHNVGRKKLRLTRSRAK